MKSKPQFSVGIRVPFLGDGNPPHAVIVVVAHAVPVAAPRLHYKIIDKTFFVYVFVEKSVVHRVVGKIIGGIVEIRVHFVDKRFRFLLVSVGHVVNAAHIIEILHVVAFDVVIVMEIKVRIVFAQIIHPPEFAVDINQRGSYRCRGHFEIARRKLQKSVVEAHKRLVRRPAVPQPEPGKFVQRFFRSAFLPVTENFVLYRRLLVAVLVFVEIEMQRALRSSARPASAHLNLRIYRKSRAVGVEKFEIGAHRNFRSGVCAGDVYVVVNRLAFSVRHSVEPHLFGSGKRNNRHVVRRGIVPYYIRRDASVYNFSVKNHRDVKDVSAVYKRILFAVLHPRNVSARIVFASARPCKRRVYLPYKRILRKLSCSFGKVRGSRPFFGAGQRPVDFFAGRVIINFRARYRRKKVQFLRGRISACRNGNVKIIAQFYVSFGRRRSRISHRHRKIGVHSYFVGVTAHVGASRLNAAQHVAGNGEILFAPRYFVAVTRSRSFRQQHRLGKKTVSRRNRSVVHSQFISAFRYGYRKNRFRPRNLFAAPYRRHSAFKRFHGFSVNFDNVAARYDFKRRLGVFGKIFAVNGNFALLSDKQRNIVDFQRRGRRRFLPGNDGKPINFPLGFGAYYRFPFAGRGNDIVVYRHHVLSAFHFENHRSLFPVGKLGYYRGALSRFQGAHRNFHFRRVFKHRNADKNSPVSVFFAQQKLSAAGFHRVQAFAVAHGALSPRHRYLARSRLSVGQNNRFRNNFLADVKHHVRGGKLTFRRSRRKRARLRLPVRYGRQHKLAFSHYKRLAVRYHNGVFLPRLHENRGFFAERRIFDNFAHFVIFGFFISDAAARARRKDEQRQQNRGNPSFHHVFLADFSLISAESARTVHRRNHLLFARFDKPLQLFGIIDYGNNLHAVLSKLFVSFRRNAVVAAPIKSGSERKARIAVFFGDFFAQCVMFGHKIYFAARRLRKFFEHNVNRKNLAVHSDIRDYSLSRKLHHHFAERRYAGVFVKRVGKHSEIQRFQFGKRFVADQPFAVAYGGKHAPVAANYFAVGGKSHVYYYAAESGAHCGKIGRHRVFRRVRGQPSVGYTDGRLFLFPRVRSRLRGKPQKRHRSAPFDVERDIRLVCAERNKISQFIFAVIFAVQQHVPRFGIAAHKLSPAFEFDTHRRSSRFGSEPLCHRLDGHGLIRSKRNGKTQRSRSGIRGRNAYFPAGKFYFRRTGIQFFHYGSGQ